ncbi:MAG: PAS domain S-box protein [Candidatus Manganitrophus sp.]|nr:MAG: PAS domain S-box protein [Candidatus Manganitrophus sp.]
MLGLHQCSHPRVWCPNEKRLFKDLSRKIADALDNLILYRNLRRSEEQYRSVVENVKEVIFQADIHGCFQFLNPAWETMTGFSVEASLGAPFWKYVHPPDKRKNEERLRSLTAGKKSRPGMRPATGRRREGSGGSKPIFKPPATPRAL